MCCMYHTFLFVKWKLFRCSVCLSMAFAPGVFYNGKRKPVLSARRR